MKNSQIVILLVTCGLLVPLLFLWYHYRTDAVTLVRDTLSEKNIMHIGSDTLILNDTIYMNNTNVSEKRNYSVLGQQLGKMLADKKLTIATAESCTGGTIASMLTSIAGSSNYVKGGIVCYATEVKERVLGVDPAKGVVSRSVAEQMADSVARLMMADCSISTTGLAGPGGGTPDCPVGTVWIAAHYKTTTEAKCYHFGGDREMVVLQAADAALTQLMDLIAREN